MIHCLQKIPLSSLSSSPVLHQTNFWATVKKQQGWSVFAFLIEAENLANGSKYQEHLLIYLHKVSTDASIAYVPYGPKTLPDPERRGLFLEDLSERLRDFLPGDCFVIRYDLPWHSPFANDVDYVDDEGKWKGPPEPRIREMRMNYGTKEYNLRKSVSDILPSSTFFVDIGEEQESLLQKMKPKTRYNIKLAKRKGVEVKEVGAECLDTVYDLYLQTALRNSLNPAAKHHFDYLITASQKAFSPNAKLKVLLASVDDKPLAAMFLTMCSGHATYLYGASSDDCRNYMGAYALQWEAICTAKNHGCREYDMFGVAQSEDPAHPMFGLYRFKSGFGGTLFHRQGCWDYPLNTDTYGSFRAQELSFEGYYN